MIATQEGRQKLLKTPWLAVCGIVLFCSLIILLPIFLSGVPYGGDQEQHLQFGIAFRDALANGNFVPKWTSNNYGFGSVGVRLYPPLPYLTLALTELVVGNWFDALSVNLFLWLLVGCLGTYLFCRDWAGEMAGAIGGLVFGIVPYHLTQIYQYFLYAEYVALSVLPFSFLFLTRLIRRGSVTDVCGFAVSFALLVIAHIPLGIIGSISLAVYGLLILDSKRIGRTVLKIGIGLVCGLCASSFYWIKVISEFRWITHNDSRYIQQVFYWATWLFPNSIEERQFMIGVVVSKLFDITIVITILLLVPPAIYLVRFRTHANQSRYRITLALVISGLFAFFMLSRASYWVWEIIPFLQKIQFPWRWLGPLSFLATAGFAMGSACLLSKTSRLKRPVFYFGVILLSAIGLYDISQSIVPSTPQHRVKFGIMVSELGTSRDANYWWPIWAKESALENREKVVASGRSVEIDNWSQVSRSFTVAAGQATDARIGTFYYPYWRALVNSHQVVVRPDADGTILIPLGDEVARVRLIFEEPVTYEVTSWLSLLTWIAIVGVLARAYLKRCC